MKRYRVDVFEEISHNHSIIFGTDTADVNKILNGTKIGRCLDDVIELLKNQGCNIEKVLKDNDNCGSIEIEDCMGITEQEEGEN